MKTFEQAIIAHEQWKATFERAVRNGGSDFEPDAVRSDNRCLLGLWLYGEGAKAVLGSAAIGMFREVHAEFHAAAADVLVIARAGRTRQAVRALAEDSPYGQWSAMMVNALERYDSAPGTLDVGQDLAVLADRDSLAESAPGRA